MGRDAAAAFAGEIERLRVGLNDVRRERDAVKDPAISYESCCAIAHSVDSC